MYCSQNFLLWQTIVYIQKLTAVVETSLYVRIELEHNCPEMKFSTFVTLLKRNHPDEKKPNASVTQNNISMMLLTK